MVILGLFSPIDQFVMGFEGLGISHYLNAVGTFATSL